VIHRARLVARVEAVSYLVLMAAVAAKYGADRPIGVQIMGPIHGTIVLVYAGLLSACRESLGWDLQRVVAAIVLGAVPFGGFWVERRWLPDGP
jgi:integral membrane protein